jgi:hypothetical protein
MCVGWHCNVLELKLLLQSVVHVDLVNQILGVYMAPCGYSSPCVMSHPHPSSLVPAQARHHTGWLCLIARCTSVPQIDRLFHPDL